MPIYNMDFETMPREALESIQLSRLKATLERVYATVPFYRESFKKRGLHLQISTP